MNDRELAKVAHMYKSAMHLATVGFVADCEHRHMAADDVMRHLTLQSMERVGADIVGSFAPDASDEDVEERISLATDLIHQFILEFWGRRKEKLRLEAMQ